LLEKQQEQLVVWLFGLPPTVAVSVLAPMHGPCFVLVVLQFAIGSVLSLIFWAIGFVKPPKLDARLVSGSQDLR
jgi:hypothetical protein